MKSISNMLALLILVIVVIGIGVSVSLYSKGLLMKQVLEGNTKLKAKLAILSFLIPYSEDTRRKSLEGLTKEIH